MTIKSTEIFVEPIFTSMVISTDENSCLDSFPIISLRRLWIEKSKEALGEAASDVDYALFNHGAFYLVDHGIDPRIMDKALRDLKTFFEKPVDEKRIYELKNKNLGRGYIPFATQNANAYSGRFGLPNDLYERFLFGGTRTKYANFDQKPDDFVEGWTPNVYAPCFKESLIEYFDAVDNLAFWLKKILSLALGQKEDFLEKLTSRASPMMKANYYPACEKFINDQPRLAEHTDVVPMTIMLQDATKDGLKAQNTRGQWVFVNPPKDALFIMTGDCTEILSNGHYRAAPHVVPYPEKMEISKIESRISLPYFVQMNNKDLLKPLPKFLEENSPIKYETTTYQDIMHKKMKNLVDTGGKSV